MHECTLPLSADDINKLFRYFDKVREREREEGERERPPLCFSRNPPPSDALSCGFDQDGNGSIGYEEFLNGLRGKMNARRRGMVLQAFARLDKDGSGVIEPDDIVDAYDASKHPDVISGKKTANDVYREFLDTFDVGGVHDGKVTKDEFENYYDNVSACIDDDDYFELMIRNAWHISGGEGWCANTANTRVLVTHADGTHHG